jgi:hypothetical protein
MKPPLLSEAKHQHTIEYTHTTAAFIFKVLPIWSAALSKAPLPLTPDHMASGDSILLLTYYLGCRSRRDEPTGRPAAGRCRFPPSHIRHELLTPVHEHVDSFDLSPIAHMPLMSAGLVHITISYQTLN